MLAKDHNPLPHPTRKMNKQEKSELVQRIEQVAALSADQKASCLTRGHMDNAKTPETDRAHMTAEAAKESAYALFVPADFARKLETQRDELRAALHQVELDCSETMGSMLGLSAEGSKAKRAIDCIGRRVRAALSKAGV